MAGASRATLHLARAVLACSWLPLIAALCLLLSNGHAVSSGRAVSECVQAPQDVGVPGSII